MGYADALEFQRQAARRRISGELSQDLLILVEHPPVVTLGRLTKETSVTATREELTSKGVALFEVERGGDVTFHGPGQLVGYTIIDLKRHRKDLHWFLRQIEEALIRTLGEIDINAERDIGRTGVWTAGRKIASIGLHARDWVTWHGFALNVTTDLTYFDLIVPCGIGGVAMTSIENEHRIAGHNKTSPATAGSAAPAFSGRSGGMTATGSAVRPTTMAAAGETVASKFAEVLGLTPIAKDPGIISVLTPLQA